MARRLLQRSLCGLDSSSEHLVLQASPTDFLTPISKIFPADSDVDFKQKVRNHLLTELGNLDWAAMLASKRLIKAGLDAKNSFDATNLRESFSQADRFASGIPEVRFAQIARKEIRHKL